MEQHRVGVLYLDMNSYFASVEQQEEPALRGRPVGVVTTLHPGACCIAASYEAKALGIGMGTRMEEARQICPEIAFRPARHDLYVAYHHRIKAAMETVLPISQTHSVDEFSCRLLGKDRGLPEARALAEAMRTQIHARVGVALRCSIGLGSSRLLAKIAGELRKPDGLDWLVPAVMPGKIAHLELTDLPGISGRMEARLTRAGIADVTALYGLAPRHARQIWGSVQGERFLRALQGEDVPDPATSTSSLGHSQVLSPENRSPEQARLIARYLLIKAAVRLRRRGLFAGSVSLSIKCGKTGRLRRSERLAMTQDNFHLLAVLDRLWTRLSPAVPLTVGVMLGELTCSQMHVADLFEDRPGPGQPTVTEQLCARLDALNQRYGRAVVSYGESPARPTPYTGAKIAFGRVPEAGDFTG